MMLHLCSLMTSPFYWVNVNYVIVGGVSVKTMTLAIFDSGTTYTYLATTAYDNVIAVVRPVLCTGFVYYVQIGKIHQQSEEL